ncbi:MAG: porin family protein [Candidatus Neomarinimicrobiota bacterium]
MRKFLLIVGATIFVFATVLPAQADWFQGLHAVGGFKYSTQAWDDDDEGDIKYRLGIEGGVGIEREYFGFPVIARALFLQRGKKWEYKTSNEFGSNSAKEKLRLNYLSFPVMVKYPVCTGYLLGGLELAFLLSATSDWESKWSYSSGDMSYSEKESGDDDVKDDFKTLDFGLVLGGGMPIPCAYAALSLEVMYFLGLTNIWDGEGDSKGRNRSLNFALVYPF